MYTTRKYVKRAVAIATLVCGSLFSDAEPAAADLLALEYGGFLSSDSTFNGGAFGAPTRFTYSVVFDSTMDLEPLPDIGVFEADVTFDIEGFGIFTGDPAANLQVLLSDPFGANVVRIAGLIQGGNIAPAFLAIFDLFFPAFDVDDPVPAILVNLTLDPNFVPGLLPFQVPFEGDDLLVINGFESLDRIAVIRSAEPVPMAATQAIFAIGLVGLGMARLAAMRCQSHS